MKKILLLILGMLLFINVKAAMITDYSSAIRGANSYMEKLHNYNLYLINESNVKYGYSANSITINSNYINGGLINVDEFNVSNSNGNSYLYNGTKYWTMTESGSNAGIVSSYITEQVSKTENYGSRVTEYIRPRIWATGSGTYNDPWVFDEDSAVNYVAKFYPTNGEISLNSKVVTYNKAYGELPTPTYTGYDFDGWYSNIVKALIWKENLGVNANGTTTSKSGYATTKDVIAIDSSILYSNVAISGVWAFDSSKTLISKVSTNATTHNLPSNTKYIRIEINIGSTPLNNVVITKGPLMLSSANINAKADTDTKLDVLEDIGLYAKWKASALTLAPGNATVQYNATAAQTKNNFVTAATGGTGSYSYTIVGGNDSAYFTLSGRNLTVKAATPVGIYPITVRVTDNNSEATAEGVMTLQVDRIAAECPTSTAYTGVYDGNAHTITVSSTTGTLNYRTATSGEGSTWTSTKPTRTDAGTTTVYLKLLASANYNETDCGSKTIKITKATPTCPTIIAYNGDYNGSAHTISVSGGVGGTIQYSTDNANWSATLPSRTNAGTTTVYVKMASNTNYNEKDCGSSTIKINKVAATCPTATSYSGNYDGNSHTITVTGGSGGTIQYSTDNANWSTTKPTRTNAGTTTVHIRVEADTNHTTITCEDRLITVNKIPATCPTVTAYSGNYDGNAHTITVTGGANGTIKYSTDNSSWSTTKPTITAAGTTTVYIKVEADAGGNYSTKTCDSSTIEIKKIAATLTCSNKTYNGAEQTACSCSGGTIGGTYKATNYSSTAYTASCTPDGNHTAPSNKTWTMSKKPITITAKAQTVSYGTAISNSTSDVTVATLVSGHSLTAITLTPSTSNYTTNGTITPSAATIKSGSTDVTSNYNITYATGTLTISKVAATLTCSNKTYNGSEQTACSCSGGTIGGTYKATNYSSTAYTASCTPDGNHTAPSNKTWTMSKKSITITAKAQTVNYGTSISKTVNDVTVATLGSGDSLTAITLTPSTSNYTTSGTITPSAATIKKGSTDVTSNYSISYATGTLKINKVAATLSCSNKTYNGTEQTACSCSGGTVGGEYKATNYRSTAYTASCTPDGNHTAPSNKTWTMSKKAATITAKAQTVNYGTAISKTTSDVTTSGLVSGHSLTAITLTQSTTNVTTNGTITPSAATIKNGSTDVTSNYNITYATGNLTILQSTATVTFSCNGSSGTAPSNVTANIGTYTVPTSKPCGYKVTAGASGKVQYQSGWATSASGSAVTSATLTSSGLTLYAVWSDLFTYGSTYYVYNDGGGHYRVEFRSSGTLTMKVANTVDIHAVGGGGGGGSDTLCNYYAGGGGGGKTATAKNKSLSATTYTITVGGGGEGGNASHTTGNTGTASSFGSLCTADGGAGGAASIRWAGGTGGNGGSGGGSGNAGDVRPCSTQGKGGSDGSNGTAGTLNTGYSGANVGAAGTGQGTTTRDFGDSGGTLRAGGGSGGNRYCAVAGGDGGGGTGGTGKGAGGVGTANYGGGGGGASQNGGSGCSRTLGGAGGSGIVIMRDKR